MSKRIIIGTVVVALAVAGGAFALQGDDDSQVGVPPGAPTLEEMAADLGSSVMEHLQRGHVDDRSGDLMLVAKPGNFVNRLSPADFEKLGTNTPVLNSSHPNPWNYLTRVPIILYGPRFADRGVESSDIVDIADLAPTYARLLGVEGLQPEGRPLPKIRGRGRSRPKVILTIVIDGGGWNTLRYHPGAWPNIEALMADGTTFVNGTIGSAPAVTGALHATFGTGTYPRTHGLPGNVMRYPNGSIGDAYLDEGDPRYLNVPTVSELWDEQTGNEAVVGTVSYESWHLGMIGRGAERAGGDHDIGVLWDTGEDEGASQGWWVNQDFYELPEYLRRTNLDRLDRYERSLDGNDGISDGLWFGHTLGDRSLDADDGKRDELWFGRSLDEVGEPATRPGTPAFARFTGDAVVDVLRREQIGKDAISDLLWVELKMPDYAGHAWNVISPEEGDVLREVDRQIGRFRAELERLVGPKNYVIAISADHGQQPLPEATGGWRIDMNEVERDIEARFGPVVEQATPADFFLDSDALEEEGVTPDDIARYLGTYSIADSIPPGAPSDRVPAARMSETVFAGAFTSDYLASLTPQDIGSFGGGKYPEARLYLGSGE